MNNKDNTAFPLVSIVTPTYNQGQFIEKTIESVLSQDYPNLEYIVMDGGSSDNTLQILEKYSGRLKWLSEKDNGQADAIQKGFALAKGAILTWLNSDDTYLPGAVKNAVTAFADNPEIGLVYGKVHYIDAAGKVVGDAPTEPFNYNRLAAATYICQPGSFFTRKAFEEAGGIDSRLHYAMDYDLWLRIFQKYKAVYLQEFIATYRLHDTSKTVADAHVINFLAENIQIAMKHFHRAPLNRVYGYCYNRVMLKFPVNFKPLPLVVLGAFLLTIKEYIKLNRGIHWADFGLLTFANFKKIFTGADGRPNT